MKRRIKARLFTPKIGEYYVGGDRYRVHKLINISTVKQHKLIRKKCFYSFKKDT